MKTTRCSAVLAIIALTSAALFSSGCAGNKMAFSSSKAGVPRAGKGVACFSLRVENRFKPSFHPEVDWVEVAAGNDQRTRFTTDKPIKNEEKQPKEYLISLELPPGQYTLKEIFGRAGNFWVKGRFKFPVDAEFSVPADKLVYVGHVTMVNRERQDHEPRSGGVFPLIDQSATGFSSGTFDIEITDRAEQDLAAFTQAYPNFRADAVEKATLHKVAASATAE